MKITTVTVHAERKFNHPHERFANFGHGVTLTAEVHPGDIADDSPGGIIAGLRRMAEGIAEQHKADILHDIDLQNRREILEINLKRWKQWPQEVEKYNQEILEAEGDLRDLADENYVTLPDRRRARLHDRYDGWYGSDTDGMRKRCTEVIEEIKTRIAAAASEGPKNVAETEKELAGLPSPRLLSGTVGAMKEIHPGHDDHPDTGADDSP